jgi:PAS domain S-box-containing protein
VLQESETVTNLTPIKSQRGDPCLIVVATPERGDLGRVLPLPRTVSVGRNDDADLVLGDSSMSRRHAQFTVDGATVTVKDLGSRNGCFLNGTRVSEAELRDGDQLRLGATMLHFHASGPAGVGAAAAQALEQSGVAHWEYEPGLGLIRWSDNADGAFALPKGSLPRGAVPLADLVHPQQRAEVAEFTKARGGAAVVECDVRLVLGPNERWVRLRGHVMRAEGSAPLGLTGTAVNVTATKQRELTVARTAQVFEHLEDAAAVTDREGRLVALNGQAVRAFGVDPVASRGRDVFEVVGVRELEAVRREVLEAVAKSRRWVGKLSLDVADQVRPFEATVFTIEDGSEAVGLAFLLRDVTEQRQLQLRLSDLDRLSSLGTLSAGIAHELNNPLSYVLANARVVLERLQDFPDDEVKEALTDLMEGATRISSIIGDLRAFSRADAQLETQPTDVAAVIEAARKVTAKLVDARAILSVEVAGALQVEAFEPRLVQVLTNLLINAAQAIPERAERGHIWVRAAPADGGVAIDVTDDGAGIPPDVVRRIFDPFFTTRPVGFGSGLGLAVCHGLVNAMGGALTVKRTAAGEGSTFRVWLRPAQARVSSFRTPLPFSEPDRKLKVLLIDDEPLVLKALQRILKVHDVTTSSAVGPALARVESGERFDVVLCDLMMPDRTGIDLYEELKAKAPDVAARIVFLTGGAFTERAERFLRQVPNRHLIKPVDATELRELVLEVGRKA